MDKLLSRQRWNVPLIILALIVTILQYSSATLQQNLTSAVSMYRDPHSNKITNIHRNLKNVAKTFTKTSSFSNETEISISNRSVVTNNNATTRNDSTVESEVSSVISSLERNCSRGELLACVQRQVVLYVNDVVKLDQVVVMQGVEIRRVGDSGGVTVDDNEISDAEEYVLRKLQQYSRNHVLSIELPRLVGGLDGAVSSARKWVPSFLKPDVAGKSSFLTGFGLGFLAFGLKKLLLPLFIGGQIVKSVLIAMFLPSILGGLGKLVGKGVSTFASASGSSGGGATNTVDDFDFKDNMGQDDASTAESSYSGSFTYPDTPYSSISRTPVFMAGTMPSAALYVPPASMTATSTHSKYRAPVAAPKVSYAAPAHYENYYTRHKQQDYKVFQNIPSSSMLLTNYDPFYSPLLSRLDSVYKQLGYDSEACRERLVCAMYRNPAKFAPYSNLVSAQLSRELNELRKPSSDNPEILRFFRYMKAAKDGQDGRDCFTQHPGCVTGTTSSSSPPMVKTYNDINKLVQARRLARQMAQQQHPASVATPGERQLSSPELATPGERQFSPPELATAVERQSSPTELATLGERQSSPLGLATVDKNQSPPPELTTVGKHKPLLPELATLGKRQSSPPEEAMNRQSSPLELAMKATAKSQQLSQVRNQSNDIPSSDDAVGSMDKWKSSHPDTATVGGATRNQHISETEMQGNIIPSSDGIPEGGRDKSKSLSSEVAMGKKQSSGTPPQVIEKAETGNLTQPVVEKTHPTSDAGMAVARGKAEGMEIAERGPSPVGVKPTSISGQQRSPTHAVDWKQPLTAHVAAAA